MESACNFVAWVLFLFFLPVAVFGFENYTGNVIPRTPCAVISMSRCSPIDRIFRKAVVVSSWTAGSKLCTPMTSWGNWSSCAGGKEGGETRDDNRHEGGDTEVTHKTY